MVDASLPDAKLNDEPARLAALRRYDVLDTPPEEPFDKLTALVRSILNVPICAVTLVDSERQWFKSRPGLGVTETARDISFCTHTIQQRVPLIVEDAKADLRFLDSPLVRGAPFIGSYAGVPLTTPDRYNVGALCAIDTVARAFTPAQIEILERFAALVVDELELRQIAQRDFLTGVMTRRAFVSEAERLIGVFGRGGTGPGTGAALVMFDVDHFKSVNDRFGHPGGDKVLQEIAARASAMLRTGDSIGRLGGEEFAILIPQTDAAGAMAFAETVRAEMALRAVTVDPAQVVTASFGVAVLSGDMSEPGQWLAAADGALYRAKSAGRDRCVLAG